MHIIKSCRPDRQTVLFSATFPRQMEALARRILNKPIEVQVGGRSIVCSDVSQEVVNFIFISLVYSISHFMNLIFHVDCVLCFLFSEYRPKI